MSYHFSLHILQRWQWWWIGLIGLYGFAFFGWLGTAGNAIGLSILILMTIANRTARQRALYDPIMWLAFVAIIYFYLHAAWSAQALPATTAQQWEAAGDWAKLTLLYPIAWWLGGKVQRLNWVYLLATGGFLIGLVSSLDAAAIEALLARQRSGFHIERPIAFGLYSATLLLGLLLFADQLWGKYKQFYRWLRFSLWLTALLILTQALITTQARGSWLAATLVIPLAVVYYYRATPVRIWRWLRSGPGIIVTITLIGLLWLNLATVTTRIQTPPTQVSATVASEPASTTSIRYRLWLWQFGLELWAQRPLFGWGPGSTEYLVEQTLNSSTARVTAPFPFSLFADYLPPPKRLPHAEHLHSIYLETLFRHGVLGMAMLILLIIVLLRALWRAYQSNLLPRVHACFLLSAFALTAIWSIFDFRALHTDWRFHWLLLASAIYTFYLHRPRDSVKHG